MGLPTLLLNKPVDFLFVFIQCHFQFRIQQILCQFKITLIHRRNFSALPDTLFFPVADQFDDPHQTLRIIAGNGLFVAALSGFFIVNPRFIDRWDLSDKCHGFLLCHNLSDCGTAGGWHINFARLIRHGH